MPLPWNRGGEEDRTPAWVDLLPLVDSANGEGSGEGRRGASEPVLVAPHRDPGEDAVNHDMPPGFESARKRGTASDGPTTPATASDDRTATPGGGEPSPEPVSGEPSPEPGSREPSLASDPAPGEAAPGTAGPGTSGPDPASADATTPSTTTLESVVSADADPGAGDAGSPTTAGGSDEFHDGTDDSGDAPGDRAEESRNREDHSDTMTVDGT